MSYVDGFVLVIPRKNLKAYEKMAKLAAKVWREYGCLDYRECIADDVDVKWGLPFPKLTNAKKSEVVFFSYIVYKSKAHRDRVNKKVMADQRLKDCCDPKNMPFDMKRMSAGGFKSFVEG